MEQPDEGTVLQRLGRIERKLDRFEDRIEAQATEAIELRRTAIETERAIRDLQDWRTEQMVYFRQIRWTFVVAGAAFFVGVINIVLDISFH